MNHRRAIKASGVFIAGTDTGVGKTLIACAMARLLSDDGIDVGVMKPVETGCRSSRRGGALIPADGRALAAAARVSDTMEEIVPYRYRAPLSPHAAARREAGGVRFSVILKAWERLRRRHSFTLVEGIGGLMVPLTPRLLLLDLIRRMGLPVLLVARSGLGTLNHTLLSLRCGGDAGIQFVGVVLNQTDPQRTLADQTNPDILRERITVPLFYFPYLKPSRHDPAASPCAPICFDTKRYDRTARSLTRLFFPVRIPSRP